MKGITAPLSGFSAARRGRRRTSARSAPCLEDCGWLCPCAAAAPAAQPPSLSAPAPPPHPPRCRPMSPAVGHALHYRQFHCQHNQRIIKFPEWASSELCRTAARVHGTFRPEIAMFDQGISKSIEQFRHRIALQIVGCQSHPQTTKGDRPTRQSDQCDKQTHALQFGVCFGRRPVGPPCRIWDRRRCKALPRRPRASCAAAAAGAARAW